MGGPATGACPGCGQAVAAEDGFCEACGRDLYPITVSVGEPGHGGPCPVCGSRVGALSAGPGDADGWLEDVSAAGARAAHEAVVGLAARAGDPPSATYVSAVATNDAVTVCWVGDSRAYWLPAGSPAAARQLTRDD